MIPQAVWYIGLCLLVASLGVIILGGVLGVFGPGNKAAYDTPTPATRPAPTPMIYATSVPTRPPSSSGNTGSSISGSDWFGCSSQAVFERLVQYSVQKDSTAFASLFISSSCIEFNSGEQVSSLDSTIGLLKVRRSGDSREYWTNREAIR